PVSVSTTAIAQGVRTHWRTDRTPLLRLGLLLLATIATIVFFMTINTRGNWDFVLPFRARKVVAMAIVGIAISVSTVAFQTITENRILTPAIMGFDALYMLIQTMVVFFFGGHTLLTLDPKMQFGVEVAIMTVFSTALFWVLFLRSRYSLYLLVMIGIIFGALFRSLTNFAQRMIEPSDFAVLQDVGFASFNAIDESLLGVATVLVLAS
ncbi:MAG: iron chelate uptake ABC transporter family permease subunit, partial [Ilumatobacter sp.]|nr:iron chelate uptake ABC transporter family permease subunit [Ilumatobacter sp.]